MGLSKKGRFVRCLECLSCKEMNGVCRICGHRDVPLLAGMVPDLIGLTQETASTRLTDPECQLVLVGVETENSETIEVGKVIASAPEADTQLTIGAPVAIVVSLGPAE